MEKYKITVELIDTFKKVTKRGVVLEEYEVKDHYYFKDEKEAKKCYNETINNKEELLINGIKLKKIKLEKITEVEVREYEGNEF